jgi:hypothetical protein
MIRSTFLIIAGLILIIWGLATVARAPLGARNDVRNFWERPSRENGDKELSLKNSDEFYKAHLTKRFLIAAVVSFTGVGFLVIGIARVPEPEPQPMKP